MKNAIFVNVLCHASQRAVRYIVSLLALFAFGVDLMDAQNNIYKIRDDLYNIYVRAYRLRNTPEGMAIADTLYAESVKAGDKKAQCIATVIPISYYMATHNLEKLEEAVAHTKELARTNNYLQYYYHADNQLIVYYLNNGFSMRALQKAQEMREQAFQDNHPFGIYSSIRNLGNIYYVRYNKQEAKRCYLEALDYKLKNLPDQDPAQLYLNITRCFISEHQEQADRSDLVDSIKLFCEKAQATARTERIRLDASLVMCHAYYLANDTVAFREKYGETVGEIERRNLSSSFKFLLDVKFDKALLDGNKEMAYSYARQIKSSRESCLLCYMAARKFGDFEDALRFYQLYRLKNDSLQVELQLQDIAELMTQTDNARLRQENMQLDLKNTTLSLERTRQQMELERRDAENNRLLLDNRELELQRLKSEADLQHAEAESEKQSAEARLRQQQATLRYRLIIFTVVVISLVISIIFLVMYLYRRRRSIHLLREKNRELSEARDEAQSANRMKTAFIQNMSHEIRTPLNAIVGFSQIVTDPDMELEADDAKEYGRLIQHNSELLTSLVNDLLGLAELESGKYVVRLSAQSCNQLCREAISTVLYRNPEHVKLYWTSEVPDDYTLLTDGMRVRQVLINFLTNAEKHTTEGEIHLHCSVSEHPGNVTFSVTDTGTGIPPEEAERIFKRFEKLDNFCQGLGLGLNICRLIAANLHGAVMLDTSYTGGARFLFILPIEHPDAAEKEQKTD